MFGARPNGDQRSGPIQTFTANQAKTHFGEFLNLVQREPVQVLKRDRVVGVMVSARDFEAMRAFYANRLQHHGSERRQRGSSRS